MLELVARVMAERLDRSRPLWKLYMVDRLEGDRWAFVWLVHHAMADGASLLELADRVLWDTKPSTSQPNKATAWHPDPEPSRAELVALTLKERASQLVRGIRLTGETLLSPQRITADLTEIARMPGTLIRELAPTARLSPLDASATTRRRVAAVHTQLAQLKRIEKALGDGITVNDVVLAAVGGGLQHWAQSRRLEISHLRVKVPTSMHAKNAAHADPIGNHDSFILVDLPIGKVDPIKRLLAVNRETRQRKADGDAQVIDSFVHESRLAPGPLRDQISKWLASPRVFSLNVSNVAGPREPVYVLGGRMVNFFSLAEIGDRHALRVAVFSCDGSVSFGLCADAAAIPDLNLIAEGIESELEMLNDATR